MNKIVAVIDPYMINPALGGFARIQSVSPYPCRYYQPTRFGIERLKNDENFIYVILGSASHIYQNLPWQKELGELMLTKLQNHHPVLGLCFGHQLMGHLLGAQCDYYSPDKKKLVGTRELTFTQDYLNIKSGDKFELAYSHRQILTKLGPDLISLSKTSDPFLTNDLIIHRDLPFLGAQAHLEACEDFCRTTCEIKNASQTQVSMNHGLSLIKVFLDHFKS